LSFRRFLLVRLGWALLALWLALTILFVITRVISLRAEDFRDPGLRFEAYRAFVQELRLDEPIHERYAHFLWDAATQDFGHSIFYASILAIGVHLLVDVIVGARNMDLRAEWPVAGMPLRT
jgi:ABC-type dipeptide/oligopeptide/nickel transport system permease component